jgi:hypothetical protein
VSFRTHAQPEEEDPTNENVEVEGGHSREGKRRTLQYYLAYIPDKARVEGEGEADIPAPTISDDDMDLLDDDESSLIKDEYSPPTGMDINMVFTILAEFRGVEEEVAQMCLGPKEAVFEKPEESS